MRFYWDHYVPTEGIVFLFGRFGTWKTPITLQILRAITRGDSELWGHGVNQASPILFVQADMPKGQFQDRWNNLKLGELGTNLYTYIAPTNIDIINPHGSHPGALHAKAIIQKHNEHRFKIVAIDCLQTIQPLNISHQETVQVVYGALKSYFHGATIILIHHERKASRDPDVIEDDAEAFAGSQAWASQAQIGLRSKAKNRKDRDVHLIHVKSHAGPEQPNIVLHFNDNQEATTADVAPHDKVKHEITEYRLMCQIEGKKLIVHEMDAWVAAKLGCGEATARRRRLDLERMEAEP